MDKAKEKMYPVSFRLPKVYADRLEKAKWELRMSKVDVVKKALDKLFEEHNIK